MPEDNGCAGHEIVYVDVAVHIPYPVALGPVHGQGKGFVLAQVMLDAAGDDPFGLFEDLKSQFLNAAFWI